MEFGGLLPVVYQLKHRPQTYQQEVIVNWLEMELPGKPSKADHLSGWRNREVYEHVKSYDWTARIYSK